MEEDYMPRFAIFLEVDDNFIVVSCGDSEWECQTWLDGHRKQFGEDANLYIGWQYEVKL